MSTSTELVNRALRGIGKAQISSLAGDSNKEGVVARLIYDPARKTLLTSAIWWFAERRAQLTASATTPTFGYDYAYPAPADFLRLVSVHPSDDDRATTPYRLGNQSGDDRVILTDSTSCYIRYVFDLQDVSVMPSTFQDALVARLSEDLADALNVALSKGDRVRIGAMKKLAKAKGIEGAEDWPTRMAEGSWVTGREDEDDDWASW